MAFWQTHTARVIGSANLWPGGSVNLLLARSGMRGNGKRLGVRFAVANMSARSKAKQSVSEHGRAVQWGTETSQPSTSRENCHETTQRQPHSHLASQSHGRPEDDLRQNPSDLHRRGF